MVDIPGSFALNVLNHEIGANACFRKPDHAALMAGERAGRFCNIPAGIL